MTRDGVLPWAQPGVSLPQTERTSRESRPGCVTRVSQRHLKKQRPELYREMNPGGRGLTLPAPIPSQCFSMDELTRTLEMKVLQLSLLGREAEKGGVQICRNNVISLVIPPTPNIQSHTVAEELFTKVIHTRRTKTTYFHHAYRFTKNSLLSHNLPLAPLEAHLPLLPAVPLPASHSLSLPRACQTWEAAWWLQSVESSFTCWYCLGLWCRVNWRHKKEWHSEILTELKSSRRW